MPVRAQDEFPRVEVFGGYSYGSLEGVGFPGLVGREEAHGWGASVAVNFQRYFGITADFAGQFGTIEDLTRGCPRLLPPLQNCFFKADINFNTHQFLLGPRFTLRAERFTIFGHALFGINRTHLASFVASQTSFPSRTESDFAMGYGGGLDVNLHRKVGIRLFQVDYLPVRTDSVSDRWQQNLRAQAGVVFRFGKR